MPYDPQRMRQHDAAAAARFPGAAYYEVLRWIHEELRPAVYVEIGVLHGESLRLAIPPTVALGIDPEPCANIEWRAQTTVIPSTSREFFACSDLPPIDLAFIDGSHLFEEVIADLLDLERYARPESVILMHDTIPLDEETSARTRTTEFYTGDVWKVVPFLRRYRPELDIVTVKTAPTGLTMIRGWNCDASHSGAFGWLENRRDAVTAWLHELRSCG
jgi:Methyltransferase domain